jgi:cobalt-zinc-cadmium resistance protein CzcA
LFEDSRRTALYFRPAGPGRAKIARHSIAAVLNGIVLVSYITQLRDEGRPLREAVLQGCANRLRPVLMTAVITIFSLVPLLFAQGPGSEIPRPLAVVVVGGPVTSTLMTLLVLPVFVGSIGRNKKEA